MKRILIVDDSIVNLKQAKSTLESEFKVVCFTSGVKLIEYLKENTADLILLDIEMPKMNGFEVVEQLKNIGKFSEIPIIFLTALSDNQMESKALSAGVVDFIAKPFFADTMLSRIKLQLEVDEYRKDLEGTLNQKTKFIENLLDAITISISELVGCRDGFTGHHIKRTKEYCKILAQKMLDLGFYAEELTKGFIEDLYRSAALHDIGKVGIADDVLGKPGKYTEEEFLVMQQHTKLGAEIIKRATEQVGAVDFLKIAHDMALYHHEKWSGNGYLEKRKGDEIPLCARILSVVDVYDALTSKRPYKEPFSHKKTVEIIVEESGLMFDPKIVEAFLQCKEQFDEQRKKLIDVKE